MPFRQCLEELEIAQTLNMGLKVLRQGNSGFYQFSFETRLGCYLLNDHVTNFLSYGAV